MGVGVAEEEGWLREVWKNKNKRKKIVGRTGN